MQKRTAWWSEVDQVEKDCIVFSDMDNKNESIYSDMLIMKRTSQ